LGGGEDGARQAHDFNAGSAHGTARASQRTFRKKPAKGLKSSISILKEKGVVRIGGFPPSIEGPDSIRESSTAYTRCGHVALHESASVKGFG
jgi:hypothetical protein